MVEFVCQETESCVVVVTLDDKHSDFTTAIIFWGYCEFPKAPQTQGRMDGAKETYSEIFSQIGGIWFQRHHF